MREHFLKEIVNNFEKVNISVIGDFILDGYYWGEVERISPEAPVPVLKLSKKEYRLGGAGNVAFNLLKLGCRTSLISFIGQDTEGTMSADFIKKCGINSDNLLVFEKKSTISKIRLMSGRQQLSRVDIESDEEISDNEQNKLLNVFKSSFMEKGLQNGVILSDYKKGVLTYDVCQEIIKICCEKDIPLVVDPKGKDWKKYCNATLIKPNYKEFKEYFSNKNLSLDDMPVYMKRLKNELNVKNVLVTLGSKGMAGLDINDNYFYLPTSASEVYDVSGAGDTVAAIITSSLCASSDLENAMILSNKGAGVVVSRIGTSACSKTDLFDCFERFKSKVVDLEILKDVLVHVQAKKKKIVYTRGNFDLFHAGHILFLQESSKKGDYLIVGLNSDEYISTVKGDKRPLLKLENRIRLLSSLECVDHILLCSDNTNKDILKKLNPDIITIGSRSGNDDLINALEKNSSSNMVQIIDIKDNLSLEEIFKTVRV